MPHPHMNCRLSAETKQEVRVADSRACMDRHHENVSVPNTLVGVFPALIFLGHAYAERFVLSIKSECLDRMVPLVNSATMCDRPPAVSTT